MKLLVRWRRLAVALQPGEKATARKLGCLIYRLIKDGQAYQEPDLHTYELKYKSQILRSLRRRAKGFGFDLVELPKAA